MKNTNRWLNALSLVALLVFTQNAFANACASNQDGSWNSASTWTNCGNTIPGSADTVSIADVVTLNTGATVSGITIISGGILTAQTFTLNLNGSLNVNAGGTFTGAGYSPTVNITGNLTNTGTFDAGQGTWTFKGTAAQTISAASSFYYLTLNNSAGLTINGNLTIGTSVNDGLLNLFVGKLTTGTNQVIFARTCDRSSVYLSRQAGSWINGNVTQQMPNWNVTCVFPVGDTNNYAPVTVLPYWINGNQPPAGALTARTDTGDHADTTAGNSGISATKSVNRYWTLSAPSLSYATSQYQATFQFCSAVSGNDCKANDVDTGATTSNFIVGEKVGATWSKPTVGTKTTTTTQALSLTSFGIFAVGETGSSVSANCISKANGSWSSSSTWSCGHVPTSTETVAIISPYTVTLDSNNNNVAYTAATLTISSGGTLTDTAGNTLTITGNITNNGTITSTGNALIASTGNAAVISGTGTFTGNAYLYISGTAPSIGAGSNLIFSSSARLYAGRDVNGNTVSGSTLTINGALNGSALTAGSTFVRMYATNTVVGRTGSITSTTAAISFRANGTLTNNGTVTIATINQSGGTGNWTNAANSSLTVLSSFSASVLNSSATGNTVTYTAPAAPVTPSSNTYYNLAGSGVTCPHGFTVLGSDPCAAAAGTVVVTKSPTSCTSVTGIGNFAWSSTSNALTSNNAYATVQLSGISNYLKCVGYGFAIPTTATILGVAISVERKSSSTTQSADGAMRLVKAGTIGTVDRSTTTTYTTSDATQMHGGSTDLWGVAWTPTDINNANFGAAFAAKTTNWRTISVDYMPITITYSSPPAAPHHIQIEHSGVGKTCAPEILTVKACADANCTSLFTTANVTGNVNWTGSSSGSLPFSIASGSTGQTSVNLSITSAQTVSLSSSSVSPSPTASGDCKNLANGTACSLTFTSSSLCLDAVEVGAAVLTPINLKLAATPFSLDIKTSNGSNYNGTVQVELVDVSVAGTTCATYTQLNTQSVTFSNAKTKTVSFNYPNASKATRVRMTASGSTPGSASSCSADGFVIRPTGLTISAPAASADSSGTSATATPTIKAGSNFTLTATALPGYDGTPLVDSALISSHSGALVAGLVGGTFAAANAATGIATGTAFTYDDVGYFKFEQNAISDKTFAALDINDGECTLDSSNSLVGGMYGCYVSNNAATNFFGRFIPDHFDTVVTNECDTFTYSGQPFVIEVLAKELAGTTTQNYNGSYAKAVRLSDAVNAASVGAISPSTIAATSFVGGMATAATAYTFTSPKTAPKSVPIRATEITGDSVSSATGTEGVADIYAGRVAIANAYGSELLDLSVPVTAEFWNGSAYVTNMADQVATCTSFVPPTISLTNGTAITATWPNVDPAVSGNVGLLNGDAGLVLAAPSVTGYADITVSVPSWLQYAWTSATKTNPTGRATFGVYAGKKVFIYRGRRGR